MQRLVTQKLGFTEEAWTELKAKALAGQHDGQKVVCSVKLDEIFIRKHVQYDGQKVRGYVDLGTVIEIHDSLPATTVHHHSPLPQHLSKMISIVGVHVCVFVCIFVVSFQIICLDTNGSLSVNLMGVRPPCE